MLSRKVIYLGIPFVLALLAVTRFHTPLQAGSPHNESSNAVEEPDIDFFDNKSNTFEKPIGQDELPAHPGGQDSSYRMNPLSPDALNPPETCGVPLRGPFGEDSELLLLESPQTLWHLASPAAWQSKEPLPGLVGTAKPETEISAVAVNSGEVFAVWRKSDDSVFPPNDINHSIWDGSWQQATPAWMAYFEDRGKPVAFALGSENLGFFVRNLAAIYCRDYGPAGLVGINVPGLVENAIPASDPAVVARDPQHVAVFYLDSQGGVWFTERYGLGLVCTGGAWRKNPVSLSGARLIKMYESYLPILSSKTPALQSQINDTPQAASGSDFTQAKPAFTLASDLSAASRNENHLAVFGVNDQNELWVKEWTNLNASDWRDTEWVKLMDNVAIERPSVVSRHSNHLGVAIRAKSSNMARYIEWSTKSGWKEPLSLGKGASSNLTSPMTLAATAKDAMSLFTVQEGQIWYRNWDEDAGWQSWQIVMDTPVYEPQALTAVVRGPHDYMLLGLDSGMNGMAKPFTSFGEDTSVTPLSQNTATSHRGQTLAWAEGEMLFAAPNSSGAQWQIDITSLVDRDTISHALPGHTKSVDNTSDHAVAAGDLDQDGSDELVFVSAPQITNNWQVEISVIDVDVQPTLTADTIDTVSRTASDTGGEVEPSIVWDVNVAIGDLDGDSKQDEVVVAFYPLCSQTKACWDNRWVIIELFEFDPQTRKLVHLSERKVLDTELGCKEGSTNYRWCQIEDLTIAIGRVDLQDKKERLIIADLLFQAYQYTDLTGYHKTYSEPSFLRIYQLTGAGALEPTGGAAWESGKVYPQIEISDEWHLPKIHREQITLGTGDMDADGIEEIAYVGDGRKLSTLYVVELDTDSKPAEVDRYVWPGTDYEDHPPSMAVGDINQDGRSEIALVPPGVLPVKTSLFQLVGGKLRESNNHIPSYARQYVLIGDLDNDSFLADLVGCNTVREVSVVAVLNSAPRWYDQAGDPIQDASAEYAKSTEQGQQETDGTSTSVGASLSIGIQVETTIPFGGPTFGYRASVENETMASMGFSLSRESSVSEENGYALEGDPEGMVIYNEFDYDCFYYIVYSPATPAVTTGAMACQPNCDSGDCASEKVCSLAHWHSPQFKTTTGGSWVDLGHKSSGGVLTNLVTTYPSELPIDPETLKHKRKEPIEVAYDVSSGISEYWSISDAVGGAQEATTSIENNTTVSQGVTVGYATLDTSSTFGFGRESSRSVSWSEDLSIATGVEYFNDSSYQCYDAWPYLYHAKASTEAGATYPYLELDWYVPHIYNCN